MATSIMNIGEGIALFGILLATAITKNYWLLLFGILPLFSWTSTDEKTRIRGNNYLWNIKELEIEKLKQEIRLLKARKK